LSLQEKITKLSEQHGGKSKLEKMPILNKIMKEGKPKSPGLSLSLSKLSHFKQGVTSKYSPSLIKPGSVPAIREHSYNQPRSPIKDGSGSLRVADPMKLVRPCSVRLVKSPELHSYPVPSPPRITPIDLSIMKTLPEESIKAPNITQKYSNPTPFISVTKLTTAIRPQASIAKTIPGLQKTHVALSPYTASFHSSQTLQRLAQKVEKPAIARPKPAPTLLKHSYTSKVKQLFSPLAQPSSMLTASSFTSAAQTPKLMNLTPKLTTLAPKLTTLTPRASTFASIVPSIVPKPQTATPSQYSYIQPEPSKTTSNKPYPISLVAAPRAPVAPLKLLPPANPMVIEISDDSD
jgi:hypothetical protein